MQTIKQWVSCSSEMELDDTIQAIINNGKVIDMVIPITYKSYGHAGSSLEHAIIIYHTK